MAKTVSSGIAWKPDTAKKRTSIGGGKIKMSSMNKGKKRGFKKYRGQGRQNDKCNIKNSTETSKSVVKTFEGRNKT